MAAMARADVPQRNGRGTTVHHVTVVATDASRTARFFTDALGMPLLQSFSVPFAEVAPLFGWTSGPDPVTSTLLGDGGGGLVEVVEYPGAAMARPPSTGIPAAGVHQLCFNVRDLDAVLAQGAPDIDAVSGPQLLTMRGMIVRIAVVEIGGLRIQVAESRAAPVMDPDGQEVLR